MLDKLAQLEAEAHQALAAVDSQAAIDAFKNEFTGRNGALTALLKSVRDVPADQRAAFGQAANKLKNELEAALAEKAEHLKQARVAAPASKSKGASTLLPATPDVTLPGRSRKMGHFHPLTQVMDEFLDLFVRLGYEVVEGPIVEDYRYNFDLLNYEDGHPALDEQESFYLGPRCLLRTQTSAVQPRAMLAKEPPMRIVSPGRVHRRDAVDATHSHTFHQLEGFVIDRGITFSDLKGTLLTFVREIFGPETRLRFRPDFFPFTEPSAEGAMTCMLCKGAGCRVCGGSGWIEVFGAGMIDPNVLAGCGIDPEEWSGFAFGFGVDRFTMLRYGIEDIRLLFSGDVRFLEQF